MSEPLFRQDPYMREAFARVTALTDEGGIVLDRTNFYPTGGGQPGDSGRLDWMGGGIDIAGAVKGRDGAIILLPGEPARLPEPGTEVRQTLAWDRRHRLMRMHTALHLLSVVIPLPVTGGQVGSEKGRLDFDMEDSPTAEEISAIERDLNSLISCRMEVTDGYITEEELDQSPELVKTLSVSPPRGQGPIRLVRIGLGSETADLQPCGGTHVSNTGEIGRVRIGRIESKGRQNRRVHLHFA